MWQLVFQRVERSLRRALRARQAGVELVRIQLRILRRQAELAATEWSRAVALGVGAILGLALGAMWASVALVDLLMRVWPLWGAAAMVSAALLGLALIALARAHRRHQSAIAQLQVGEQELKDNLRILHGDLHDER